MIVQFRPIRHFKIRKCRVCGCTWNHACPGGCSWIEKDLCSRCGGIDETSKIRVSKQSQSEKYDLEISKLNKLKDYAGNVFSIYDENAIISQAELTQEMIKMLTEECCAPTVVLAESGERLNMTALYLECVARTIS